DDAAYALGDLNAVLQLDSSNIEARVLRARIYNQQHLTDQALDDLNRVLALAPQDAASYQARAKLLQQLGDLAGAQADLERAQALQPGNVELALRQAALLEAQGQPNEALALYRQAIAASDAAAQARLYLHVGKLRYTLGQYRRALANFQAA